ncbi:hypothetical protein D3C80_1266390 [compost metagenome]
MLKLGHFARAVVDEMVDHVLFTQPIATGNGVVEVVVEAIVILSDGGGASFSGHRMAAHRVDF